MRLFSVAMSKNLKLLLIIALVSWLNRSHPISKQQRGCNCVLYSSKMI